MHKGADKTLKALLDRFNEMGFNPNGKTVSDRYSIYVHFDFNDPIERKNKGLRDRFISLMQTIESTTNFTYRIKGDKDDRICGGYLKIIKCNLKDDFSYAIRSIIGISKFDL